MTITDLWAIHPSLFFIAALLLVGWLGATALFVYTLLLLHKLVQEDKQCQRPNRKHRQF